MKLLSPLAFLLLALTASAAEYPVAFLHVQSNPTDVQFKRQSFSEGGGPYVHHAGTSLSILETDGTERVLVEGLQPDKGLVAVHDRKVSLDGQWYYYSHIRTFPDKPGKKYCDLFKIPVAGGEPIQLTNAKEEWRPPSGVYLENSDEQVWNTAPCPTPEGLVFCSDRDGIKSPGEGFRGYLLYILDNDGHTRRLDFMNFGGVLHPIYHDGRVYFATAQQQGLRQQLGNGWAWWSIKPDGTDFQPNRSAFLHKTGLWHLGTFSSDGTSIVDRYYDTRETGAMDAVPRFLPSPFGPASPFGNPVALLNPYVWDGWDKSHLRVRSGNFTQFSWQPRGMFNPFPWSWDTDKDNTSGTDPVLYQREIGSPVGVPGNKILLDWNGDKPDRRDRGVYLSKHTMDVKFYPPAEGSPDFPSDNPHDYLEKVVDNPDRHEWFGEAVVSYEAIYGTSPPAMTPSPKSAGLPSGSPYTQIGSTSVDRIEIVNLKGTARITVNPEEIYAIRILSFNPTQWGLDIAPEIRNPSTKSREGFSSAINERMSILGEIPVRKYRTPDGKLHVGDNAPEGSTLVTLPDGRPDTSWSAYIPADNAYSFSLVKRDGTTIPFTFAQTWRQGRPGEQRNNCQGCHNHSEPDSFPFTECAAGLGDYVIPKFTKARTVIYQRDIVPIEQATGVEIGPRPYAVAGGPQVFHEASWAVLQDERLNTSQRRTLAEWCATGFMAATTFNDGTPITPETMAGPYADTMPPVLTLETFTTKTLIGAADPDSGVNWESLSVAHNGQDIADQFVRDGDIFSGPALTGVVTIGIRDNQHSPGAEQGNLTKFSRTVRQVEPPPEPDPDTEEIARLKAEIEQLKSQMETLNAKLQEWKSWHKNAPKE